MAWLEEWANAATDLKDRLEREPRLHSCGTRMVLGYSNLRDYLLHARELP